MRFLQIDAFTDRPFAGNPAAVFVLAPGDARATDAAWMQAVAGEMNLSETAFATLNAGADPAGSYRLRWFTPAAEVRLCGHATLATAHALWQDGHIADDADAVFHTLSGILRCRRLADGRIEMDFPARPFTPLLMPDSLADGLGAAPTTVGWATDDVMAVFDDAATVRGLRPDIAALARVEARGVIVTAPGDRDGVDAVSRFFAPRVGVDEDPVTGSAHCAIGPYWAERLGRTVVACEQASERGGTLDVEVRGARVALRGHAVTVFEGRMVGGV